MSERCFHCAEPIEDGVRLLARIGVQDCAVCCIGCQAAAEWINGLGLHDYYRLRDTPAITATALQNYAAWDRPQLQRLYVRHGANGVDEICVLVEGLRCSACSWLIERALRDVQGVTDVAVNAAAKRLTLNWRPDTIALSAILLRLARLGYVPHPLDATALDAVARNEQRLALKRLLVAGLGMMQSMMYAIALYAGAFEGMNPETRDFFRWLGLLVTTPVILYAGVPFFAGAWREWRARTLGMNTPVAAAVALVYVASVIETIAHGANVYFDSASMFIFLLLGARYIEMHARFRAADVADALARLQPALAQRRLESGALEMVGVHELNANDVVVVDAGAAIPADGILLSTRCSVDESLLTGEADPRLHLLGDALIAGSVARSGPIELRVQQIGAETVLSSIVRLVTRAQQQRPHWAHIGDRFATVFVSAVLGLTLVTAAVWLIVDPSRAFAAALAVLVVSCPCAFALSVPAALTRAMALLARSGVLVLKPDALEKLVRADHFVFDKTGTLTSRQLELTCVIPFGRLTINECLDIAAQLECGNAHPFALAIRNAPTWTVTNRATKLQQLAGLGVEGEIDGKTFRLGRSGFAAGLCGSDPDLLEDGVLLADRVGPLARFVFREQLRDDAAAVIASLHGEGITTEIVSGDATAQVENVAARIAVDSYRSRMSPSEKLDRLRTLRGEGRIVAMVGDGVNDAPVLAGADVAIALGDGALLAQSSADIVLASNRLGALVDARILAKSTLRILRQNLIWAFVYNLGTIPLAALGFVPPWLAAIGMSTSSLFVVINAMRIGPPARKSRGEIPIVAKPRELVTT
ncbi:MAG: heavy metal translocating P-type ATPase [Rudaea sp.]